MHTLLEVFTNQVRPIANLAVALVDGPTGEYPMLRVGDFGGAQQLEPAVAMG